MIPTVVNLRHILVVLASSEGFPRAQTAIMRRTVRGLRNGGIVGRFNRYFDFPLVVISSRHDCYLSLLDDLLAERIKTIDSAVDLNRDAADVVYRGVELADELSSFRPRRRGFGGANVQHA